MYQMNVYIKMESYDHLIVHMQCNSKIYTISISLLHAYIAVELASSGIIDQFSCYMQRDRKETREGNYTEGGVV